MAELTDYEDNIKTTPVVEDPDILNVNDIVLRKLERRALADRLANDAEFRADYEAKIKAKADKASINAPTTPQEFDMELAKRQANLEEAFSLADELCQPRTASESANQTGSKPKSMPGQPTTKPIPPKYTKQHIDNISLPDDISLDELTKLGQALETLVHIDTVNIHHITININR